MDGIVKSKRIENSIQNNYHTALLDPHFEKLVSSLNLEEKELKNYTTQLQDCVCSLEKCKTCKGLVACTHKVAGYQDYPVNYNGHLQFYLKECRYLKKKKEEASQVMTSEKILETASMKDIDTTDKKRFPLIKWVSSFIKEYDSSKPQKGLYLHGNFGCGKTYILACCFNELKKRGVESYIVYFPTLLRDLKSDFDEMNQMMHYLCDVELLLIDDLGAEKVTEWSRDEILGTILQERMNHQKTTFFTSNFNLTELEEHLSCGGKDMVKATRIMERIKQLSTDMEMISKNRRNEE